MTTIYQRISLFRKIIEIWWSNLVNLHSFVTDNCIIIHNLFSISIAPPHFPHPNNTQLHRNFVSENQTLLKSSCNLCSALVKLSHWINSQILPDIHCSYPVHFKESQIWFICTFFVHFDQIWDCLLPLMILIVTTLIAVLTFIIISSIFSSFPTFHPYPNNNTPLPQQLPTSI